ncbi:MAG: hypothetical protein H6712_21805 [Myxococcales bacterium]|nr:hypothetical protein [Myxococcales bacterium]MCB9716512.1 hypothetical protein [Myxococcales bacterium]
MGKKLSLDDVISQLRASSMEEVVDTGRIKGGLASAGVQEGCHVPTAEPVSPAAV